MLVAINGAKPAAARLPFWRLAGRAFHETLSGQTHIGKVLFGPVSNRFQGFCDRLAKVGQGVFDPRRTHVSEHLSVDHAIFFEAAQGLGQHLLGDAGNGPSKLPEPVRALIEASDDQDGPLGSDEVQHVAAGTVD